MFYPKRHASPGFTLIEVMIVVALIGILTAIAVPAYNDYMIRGKISDAVSGLSNKQVAMEQFFLDNRTYENGPGCTADSTTSKYFDFSCSVAGTTTVFTMQAVGKANMTGFTYTLNQAGTKTTAIAAPAPSGWRTAATQPCWLMNTGGAC